MSIIPPKSLKFKSNATKNKPVSKDMLDVISLSSGVVKICTAKIGLQPAFYRCVLFDSLTRKIAI